MSNDQTYDPEEQIQTTEQPPVEDEEVKKTPIGTFPGVELEQAVFEPYVPSASDEPLVFTPRPIDRVDFNAPGWQVSKKDPSYQAKSLYAGRVYYGLQHQHISGAGDAPIFKSPLSNNDAKWQQEISFNGSAFGFKSPKISVDEKEYTGSAASDIISAELGEGTSAKFDLPTVGLHVRIQARSESDYLSFQYRHNLASSTAGNDTYGIIHQNSHVGTVERVWEYIRDSIVSINLADHVNYDLGDVLPVTELATLYWGQSCTMYPNGYPLDLVCSSGVNGCTHVESVKLNLRKCRWTNFNALTKTQLSRLAAGNKQYTLDDVKLYQETGGSPIHRQVKVSDTILLDLKIPTINEYIQAGKDWIDNCVRTAREIFKNEAEEVTPEEIKKYVQDEMTLNAVREYSHWISKITVGGRGIVVERDAINNALEKLSGKPELSEKIFVEIQKFIEDATISIIATPNFACPKCQQDYVTAENSRHPELVPLDMLRLFFTLVGQRLSRLSVPATS